MKNHYYLYLLIDPRSNLPFYVGKGKGNRIKNHKKEFFDQLEYYSKIYNSPLKILSLKHQVFFELSELNLDTKIEIIDNLSEADALLLEEALIAWLGRKICGNGILTNLLSGGKNGQLMFDDQALIEVYNREDLLVKIRNYPKFSTSWVSKSLYFYDRSLTGYPFKELGLDWLYKFHGCNQQFALFVIEILSQYDAVISPFYWVRKVQQKSFKEDHVYIMRESLELLDVKDIGGYQLNDFEQYKSEYHQLIESNKNRLD